MDKYYFRYYGVKVVSYLSIFAALGLIFIEGMILTGIAAFIGGQFISYLISGGRSMQQLEHERYYGENRHL